jgi:ribose transport system substrate-binding protein
VLRRVATPRAASRPRRRARSRSPPDERGCVRPRPGDGELAALRANGNTKTKLVSLDLDEPLALDIAKGGNTFALVADKAYELGRAMAKAAAYGLLGKKAPAFVVAPALTITRSNLVEGYRESLHRDPPASVLEAVGR